MKVTIEISKDTMAKVVDTGIETANIINQEPLKSARIDDVRTAFLVDHKVAGPATLANYTVGNDTATFCLELDDEAVSMALPFAIDIANALSPVIKLVWGYVKILTDASRLTSKFLKSFKQRFGRRERFAAMLLNNGIAAVVRDDGFGNYSVSQIYDQGQLVDCPADCMALNKEVRGRIAAGEHVMFI